jgi:hypothetical protein
MQHGPAQENFCLVAPFWNWQSQPRRHTLTCLYALPDRSHCLEAAVVSFRDNELCGL